LQHGVVAAFDLPPQYYREMQQGYDRKLEMMTSACDAIGMRAFDPEGAYYLLADLGELPFEDDIAAASGLLERARVACVPGSSFYPEPEAGRRQLRFCFAKQEEDLAEACRRLREAFA
jgi:aminotransferase